MREGNIIKRTFAAMLACVIVFMGGIGITARRALAYNAGVEAFVNSLYSDCLGRTADPAGFNDWCTRLTNGSITGIPACAPILPKPSTAVPLVTTATRLLLEV